MASKWYYESDGAVYGPISSSDMRNLAANGEITHSTRVRPADRETWLTAEKLRDLFPDDSTRVKHTRSERAEQKDLVWYLRDITGKMFGPVTRTQLDEWYQSGQICAACHVKHKEWPEWQGAGEVYTSLNERRIDWERIRKNTIRLWRMLRDRVDVYYAGLTINWSPSPQHLRRCIANSHVQFATHAPCVHCGQPTIGHQVADVANGDDDRRQQAYTVCAKAKQRVSSVSTWSLLASILISCMLFVTTSWFVVLVPTVIAIGVALPYFSSRLLNARIERAVAGSSRKLPQQVLEQEIDEMNSTVVDPFLQRSEVALGTIPRADSFLLKRFKSLEQTTDVLVDPEDRHMLEQVLAGNGITLWTNPDDSKVVLSAFVLKSDYSLFKHRIEQLESAGMSALSAYASLVNRDDAFLPFLQQLLADRQMPESAASLLSTLNTVRRELKFLGFEKDLELRRHGNMSITMEMVDGMNPYKFELLLGMIYETQGCRVIETPKSGDQGADVLLEKAGERTVIQAKLYSAPVGNKAVQEAIAARSHFRCHAAKVVTNNYFTTSAQELAQSSDVHLMGRDELSQMISEFNRSPKDYSRLATLLEAANSTTVAASEEQ